MGRGKCIFFNEEHENEHIWKQTFKRKDLLWRWDVWYSLGTGVSGWTATSEYVEQLVPEVLLSPSEVGGVVEIELDVLGQLIVFGQVSQLDDDDARHVIFQGLDVGRIELRRHHSLSRKFLKKKRNTIYQQRRDRIHFVIIQLLVKE
ncbi:hypothetical protein CEXT_171311 [Caerostris extrusa]|uniref:Uncharacterized protein n=1 Tax=Caerostris extrusa TaxID=172846 RepID=A0AAV4Y6M8_CAEEX|nr:hypothetical protein CEXT_171311 [Caerostris extrusa]